MCTAGRDAGKQHDCMTCHASNLLNMSWLPCLVFQDNRSVGTAKHHLALMYHCKLACNTWSMGLTIGVHGPGFIRCWSPIYRLSDHWLIWCGLDCPCFGLICFACLYCLQFKSNQVWFDLFCLLNCLQFKSNQIGCLPCFGLICFACLIACKFKSNSNQCFGLICFDCLIAFN